MPGRRDVGCVVAAAVLAITLHGSGARADWVVDERGECVSRWTAASLGRGPTALLNAPLVPFRSVVGGVLLAREAPNAGLQEKILLPPLLAVGGGATGLVEALVWAGAGLADTATGGYLEIAPEEATELSVEPIRPPFAPVTARAGGEPTDRCGRPRASGTS